MPTLTPVAGLCKSNLVVSLSASYVAAGYMQHMMSASILVCVKAPLHDLSVLHNIPEVFRLIVRLAGEHAGIIVACACICSCTQLDNSGCECTSRTASCAKCNVKS